MSKIVSANRIVGSALADQDETIVLQFEAGQKVTTLKMNVRLAAELMDTISALNEEAMAKRSPAAPNMKTGAYRRVDSVTVNLDATASVLLIDFDRGARHRVAVAIPADKGDAVAAEIQRWTKRARESDRSGQLQ